MAKALLGHVGYGPDVRTIAEVQRLRERVRNLEADNHALRDANVELRDANGELTDRLHDLELRQEMLSLATPGSTLSVDEPALTRA